MAVSAIGFRVSRGRGTPSTDHSNEGLPSDAMTVRAVLTNVGKTLRTCAFTDLKATFGALSWRNGITNSSRTNTQKRHRRK